VTARLGALERADLRPTDLHAQPGHGLPAIFPERARSVPEGSRGWGRMPGPSVRMV